MWYWCTFYLNESYQKVKNNANHYRPFFRFKIRFIFRKRKYNMISENTTKRNTQKNRHSSIGRLKKKTH